MKLQAREGRTRSFYL